MKNESADVKPITGGGQAGYKCPPAAHRFRKGRSGHPSGRPKDVRNAVTDLVEVLNQPVTVSQGGEAKQVTKGDALVKVLMNMATKGDRRAVDALFTLMDRIERLVDPPEADKGVGVMVVPGVGTPEEWKLLMAQKRIHDAEKEKQRIADAPKIEKKEAALRKIIALKQGTPEAAEAAVHLAELTSSMAYLSNFYIRRNLTPEDREALLNEPEKVPVVVKLPWDPDEYVRMPFHKRDEYARTHVENAETAGEYVFRGVYSP
jgi:hypothetical protein